MSGLCSPFAEISSVPSKLLRKMTMARV